MNAKKLFIFCILASAKIISAMDGLSVDDPNVAVKVVLRPMCTFENADTYNDKDKTVHVEHKSLLILVHEAYHQTFASSINQGPFKELVQKFATKEIDLDRPEGSLTLLTDRDLYHRLCPYILWTGRRLPLLPLQLPNCERIISSDATSVYLKSLQRFAILCSNRALYASKSPNLLNHIYFTLEDFSAEGEISKRPIDRYKQLVSEIVTATVDKQKNRSFLEKLESVMHASSFIETGTYLGDTMDNEK